MHEAMSNRNFKIPTTSSEYLELNNDAVSLKSQYAPFELCYVSYYFMLYKNNMYPSLCIQEELNRSILAAIPNLRHNNESRLQVKKTNLLSRKSSSTTLSSWPSSTTVITFAHDFELESGTEIEIVTEKLDYSDSQTAQVFPHGKSYTAKENQENANCPDGDMPTSFSFQSVLTWINANDPATSSIGNEELANLCTKEMDAKEVIFIFSD